MKTLRWILLAALSVVWSCADVGTEGTGGTGGPGGTGGTGGSGAATTLERNTVPVPAAPATFAAEATDNVNSTQLVADGEVLGMCEGGTCSAGDPVDQFRLLVEESGVYVIGLSWPATGGSDLDLFFLDAAGNVIDQSVDVGTTPESIMQTLSAGQTYVIHVQAFDTFDATQAYTLQVTAP